MLNLDRIEFDLSCPLCRFQNGIFYRQARLRDVVICRGCKANIQLDDQMNECRKARRQVNQAMADLERSLAAFSKTITLKF
jgi:hypothetical protein